MNTETAVPRGMTLLEVMVALGILAVAGLGLFSGVVVAVNTNGFAARRTQMAAFAQSRLDQLVTRTRTRISAQPAAFAGPFNPSAPPGTGGWVLDALDPLPGAGQGDDAMAGPALVMFFNESSGVDIAATRTTRTNLVASTSGLGCGDPIVATSSAVLCREIHIEPVNALAGTNPVAVWRTWVRVVQGGGGWRASSVLLRQDIAQ